MQNHVLVHLLALRFVDDIKNQRIHVLRRFSVFQQHYSVINVFSQVSRKTII